MQRNTTEMYKQHNHWFGMDICGSFCRQAHSTNGFSGWNSMWKNFCYQGTEGDLDLRVEGINRRCTCLYVFGSSQ